MAQSLLFEDLEVESVDVEGPKEPISRALAFDPHLLADPADRVDRLAPEAQVIELISALIL